MKKIILILVSFFIFTYSYSQITLDTTANTSFTLIKLEYSGYKYWMYDLDSIILLNLDLTPFKKFPIVLAPGLNVYAADVIYITEALFNTDSTSIEYMLVYNNNAPVQYFVAVYDEFGATLLYANNTLPMIGILGIAMNLYAPNYLWAPIENTPLGTKLFLQHSNAPYVVDIYNLPGSLPCDNCNSGSNANVIGEINGNKPTGSFNLFPNPFSKNISSEYYFPDDAHEGNIAVYDNLGNQLKKIPLKEQKGNVKINCEEFSHGFYYFELISEKGFHSGRKIVKL
jgi:hypothetical protein